MHFDVHVLTQVPDKALNLRILRARLFSYVWFCVILLNFIDLQNTMCGCLFVKMERNRCLGMGMPALPWAQRCSYMEDSRPMWVLHSTSVVLTQCISYNALMMYDLCYFSAVVVFYIVDCSCSSKLYSTVLLNACQHRQRYIIVSLHCILPPLGAPIQPGHVRIQHVLPHVA